MSNYPIFNMYSSNNFLLYECRIGLYGHVALNHYPPVSV
uniref:Uncharacterized protein n=1 Tax=Anguilla anguilla TaxID=7936 RepID=A0A0E9VPF3_ANGAN